MKTCRSQNIAPPFLALVLSGVNAQLQVPTILCLQKETPPSLPPCNTNWIGGSVGPRASLGTIEKRTVLPLLGIEPWLLSPWPITVLTRLSQLSFCAACSPPVISGFDYACVCTSYISTILVTLDGLCIDNQVLLYTIKLVATFHKSL